MKKLLQLVCRHKKMEYLYTKDRVLHKKCSKCGKIIKVKLSDKKRYYTIDKEGSYGNRKNIRNRRYRGHNRNVYISRSTSTNTPSERYRFYS